MTAAGICVFFEHAPLPTAGSSAAPGLLAIQIPLSREKIRFSGFYENPSRKHSPIQVFADQFPYADSGVTAREPAYFKARATPGAPMPISTSRCRWIGTGRPWSDKWHWRNHKSGYVAGRPSRSFAYGR